MVQRIFTKNEYKWFRVAIFAFAFMAIPSLLQSGWNAYWKYYYQTAPIGTFYQPVQLEAESVCKGDLTQKMKSVRFVYGTETGWQADIVRELDRVDDANLETEFLTKVWEQDAKVFIEVVPDGVVHRETALPVDLPIGLYQWEITVVRLYLPYGVERVVSPTLTSNVFAVEDCNNIAYGRTE